MLFLDAFLGPFATQVDPNKFAAADRPVTNIDQGLLPVKWRSLATVARDLRDTGWVEFYFPVM